MPNIDPELMQDFLTESGELLERLDQDLVAIEGHPSDPEMLNQVFRALHTIKGSASFLGLTNLVGVAHVAEGALNAARNRVVTLDRGAMDLLLAAVDTIKRQFVQLRAGEALEEADAKVVAGLSRIADGKAGSAAAPAPAQEEMPTNDAAPMSAASAPQGEAPAGATEEKPLNLSAGKADLLDFLVSDLEQTLDQVESQVGALRASASRRGAAESLAELAESLRRSVEFFEFESMGRLTRLIGALAERATGLPEATMEAAVADATGVVELLRTQSKGLARGAQVIPPMEALIERFEALLRNEDNAEAGHDAAHAEPVAEGAPEHVDPGAVHVATKPVASPEAGPPADPAGDAGHSKVSGGTTGGSAGQGAAHAAQNAEATIRVEVGRLETLLNLVGELVLQKNRMGALARQLSHAGWGNQEYREAVQQASGGLDRVTSDLQTAVMRTRMQPLEKIFGKYPRLVRDLARKLNKQINLELEGGQTEVDKSVIEELGDPLIHLMRNSADHGIESPEARRAAGKPEMGTIRLSASNTGGHVEIRINDDGKGLDPAVLARKAVEKGVVTQAEVDGMSDRERLRLIFLPGFSTAEKVSDVSGRGVGMDVVRTNIEKIKGTIDLQSVPGRGATVIITIPLTVAIMSAMMVGVGAEVYAVPLSHVIEIVKPTAEQRSTINRQAVMRLRDGVLPLLRGTEEFGVRGLADGAEALPFVVVLSHNEKRVGLEVSRLIGQQEIVIKPLDGCIDKEGPVSGATVRDDGGVSLIVDVPRLAAIAEARQRTG
jgi:two-component system chemotaxis sensor kinase CheA